MGAEWTAMLMLCGIYSMTAIAVQLGMLCGAFSLAPIGWMAVGAYVAALGATKWGLAGIESLAIAIVIAGLLGPIIMLPVRRISGLYFALVSLAFVLVVQSIFSHTEYMGGALGIFGVPLTTDLGGIVLALVIVAAVAAYMSSGRRGRALRAAGQDPVVAQAMGVDVFRLQLVVGSISAVFAVVAGFLYAGYVGYVDPTQYGFAMVVNIIVMVIVGGRGSWVGTILGACFITVLPLVLRPLAEWREVFNGALLILVAVMLPGGLFDLGRIAAGWLRPGAAALAAVPDDRNPGRASLATDNGS
jgi:branched-chain amino acid transport system permease protein